MCDQVNDATAQDGGFYFLWNPLCSSITQNDHVFSNNPMNEVLTTSPATFLQYPNPLFPRYDDAHSSTGDGVRGSNSSNENESETNIDEENEKVFLQL